MYNFILFIHPFSSSLSSSQSSLLSEEEESQSQDHTPLGLEGDTSQEYQTPQEIPIRKHSKSHDSHMISIMYM